MLTYTSNVGKDLTWYASALGAIHATFGRGMIGLALFTIYLGLDLYCVNAAAFAGYSVMIFFILFGFAPFELLRWCSPWSAAFGGVGFTYRKPQEKEGEYHLTTPP